MKGKKKWWKISSFLMLCLVMLLLPVQTISAENIGEQADTSLTLHYKYGTTTFTFHKVANFSETGKFDLVEPFLGYADKVTYLNQLEDLDTDEWRALALTLDSCISSDSSVIPMYQGQTDENGTIVWENLEKGLYLIAGEMTWDEKYIYQPNPTLVTVPNRDADGAWNAQVVIAHDKANVEEIPNELQEYEVLKIWKDTGYEKKRPQGIEVTLLKDGTAYDKVTLNEENNWKYIWTDLEPGHEWKVDEVEVPSGYTKRMDANHHQYVITNTYQPSGTTDTPNSPGGGKLPQTGQLWWPVSLLAVLGMTAFLIGWARRKSDEG